MKKKICIISTIIILAVFALGGFIIYRNRFSLSINGNAISKEEFLDAAGRKRYEVSSYFSKEGSNVDSDFWEREVNGEIPYEKLAEAAIEDLKYFHAVYGLAEEKGYVDNGSYDAFLGRWEKENALRKEKIEQGGIVYGLSEYTLELYQEYEMDTIQKSYCGDLENEGREVTDAEREQYYTENETFYQRSDDRILDYIKIPYLELGLNEEQIKELKKSMTSVYKQLGEGRPLSELAGEEEQVSAYLSHADVTAENLRACSRSIEDVLEYAWELEAGESTSVLDEGGSLYLIECTDRSGNDPASIEEVKDNINKALREERYEAIVRKRAENAIVEGDMERIFYFMKKHIEE